MPGIIDIKIITKITIEKLFLTNGRLPKKYPKETNDPTQIIAAVTLNIINRL